MIVVAFVLFAILVACWLIAPSRTEATAPAAAPVTDPGMTGALQAEGQTA